MVQELGVGMSWAEPAQVTASSHGSCCVCMSSFLKVFDFPPKCCSEVKVEAVCEHWY